MSKIEITVKTEKARIDQVCKEIRKVFPAMKKSPEVEMIGSDGRNLIYTRIFVIRDAEESQDTKV